MDEQGYFSFFLSNPLTFCIKMKKAKTHICDLIVGLKTVSIFSLFHPYSHLCCVSSFFFLYHIKFAFTITHRNMTT